jgi:hypothetical protein
MLTKEPKHSYIVFQDASALNKQALPQNLLEVLYFSSVSNMTSFHLA